MYTMNCSLLLFVLAWAFKVSSSPAPINLSVAANLTAVANLTFGPIPNNFKIRPNIVFPMKFTQEAVVINIVQALKTIGKGDFKGEMPTLKYSTARYPQPVISVRQPDEQNIKREYVVWGLLLSLLVMYKEEQGFHWTHFTLLLDDEEVGGLGFGSPRGIEEGLKHHNPKTSTTFGIVDGALSISQVPSSSSTTSGAALPMVLTEAPNLAIPSNNNPLKVDFQYRGRAYGKGDMFVAIVWAMAVAAIPPSNAILPDRWNPGVTDSACKFFMEVTPRRTPPYFQFFWLIETLAETADYLVEHKVYRGLSLLIKIYENPIGTGTLAAA
ncbi:hypothetical protein G7Y79_00026g059690 [Physcia stellaris]|nr:hypothetical protein G7Y79_00026g059690 [Physcia stellaris]